MSEPITITKRCDICGRFRAYQADDRFCLLCGNNALSDHCQCGRPYDYVLAEDGDELHCPRCGRSLHGRAAEFEP